MRPQALTESQKLSAQVRYNETLKLGRALLAILKFGNCYHPLDYQVTVGGLLRCGLCRSALDPDDPIDLKVPAANQIPQDSGSPEDLACP